MQRNAVKLASRAGGLEGGIVPTESDTDLGEQTGNKPMKHHAGLW